MSIRAIYELGCDDGCGSAFAAPVEALHNSRLIEAAAEAEGWQTRHRNHKAGRRHRCPDCAVKANAMKEPGRIIPPMRLDELEQVCRESRDTASTVPTDGGGGGSEVTA